MSNDDSEQLPRTGLSSTVVIVIESPLQAILPALNEETRAFSTPESLAAHLSQQNTRQAIVLLKSTIAFPVILPITARRTISDPRRLAFLAEEKLPFSAEEMTIAARTVGDRVMAVALLTRDVKPWIKSLGDAGVDVDGVYPLGLAQLQWLALQSSQGDGTGFLVETDTGWEVGVFCNHEWIQWSTIVGREKVPHSRFAIALKDHHSPAPIVWLKGETDIRPELHELATDIVVLDEPKGGILNAVVASIHEPPSRPCLNLSVGELGPRDPLKRWRFPVTFAASGVFLLFVAIGVVLWQRTQAIEMNRGEFEKKQAEVFRRLFPTEPVPIGIENRLRSELARLEKGREIINSNTSDESAFYLLHEALARLPKELRYRVARIGVAQNRLILEGEARSHSDVEIVAQQLAKDGRFKPSLPRTRKGTEKSVSFAMTVEIAKPVHAEGAK